MVLLILLTLILLALGLWVAMVMMTEAIHEIVISFREEPDNE